MNQFQINTEIVFGQGALNRLSVLKDQRVLVVCDPFIEKAGMANLITDKLLSCEIVVFSDVVPDPSLAFIAKGVEALCRFHPSVLIALGGGSAIDTAKAMYEFSRQLEGVEVDITDFIALPTTSGTGSEVTSFSVVSDTDNQVKIPLVDDAMMPDVAILAPELTVSVPQAITADTGMDVITHAVEAIVSRRANDFTDALAEKALTLAFEYLTLAFKNGKDTKAREKLHAASCLAGIAFNQAGLGINHSLAHAIGGRWHIPHGRANALLLPIVIEFNAQITGFNEACYSGAAVRYKRMARLLGLTSQNNTAVTVNALIKALQSMLKLFDIPQTLKAAGIDEEDLILHADKIAETALADVCTQTNPRSVNEAQLKQLFLAAAGLKS